MWPVGFTYFFPDSMNLSYSTAILQDRACRLWAAEQLVLTAWLPEATEKKHMSGQHQWRLYVFECHLPQRHKGSKPNLYALYVLTNSQLAPYPIKTMCISVPEMKSPSWNSPIFFFSSSSSPSVKMYVCKPNRGHHRLVDLLIKHQNSLGSVDHVKRSRDQVPVPPLKPGCD